MYSWRNFACGNFSTTWIRLNWSESKFNMKKFHSAAPPGAETLHANLCIAMINENRAQHSRFGNFNWAIEKLSTFNIQHSSIHIALWSQMSAAGSDMISNQKHLPRKWNYQFHCSEAFSPIFCRFKLKSCFYSFLFVVSNRTWSIINIYRWMREQEEVHETEFVLRNSNWNGKTLRNNGDKERAILGFMPWYKN